MVAMWSIHANNYIAILQMADKCISLFGNSYALAVRIRPEHELGRAAKANTKRQRDGTRTQTFLLSPTVNHWFHAIP